MTLDDVRLISFSSYCNTIQSHLRRHEHETILKGANYVSEEAAYPGNYGGPGYGGGGGGPMRKFGGQMKKGPGYGQPGMKTRGPGYQGGEGGWPKGPGGGKGGPDGYRNNQGMLCPYCVEYVCSYLISYTSNLISILLYSIISGFKHQKTHHHHYYDYDDGEDGEDEGYDGGGGGGEEEDEGYDDGPDGYRNNQGMLYVQHLMSMLVHVSHIYRISFRSFVFSSISRLPAPRYSLWSSSLWGTWRK